MKYKLNRKSQAGTDVKQSAKDECLMSSQPIANALVGCSLFKLWMF